MTNEPQPDKDGWIEWKGRARPVEMRQAVEIEMLNGDKEVSKAGEHDWYHTGGCNKGFNIIAYRLLAPVKPLTITKSGAMAATGVLNNINVPLSGNDDSAHNLIAEIVSAALGRDVEVE
jgi:hypothetical protein